MEKRFACLWFRHLLTDWFTLQQPELKVVPFVLAAPIHGRMVITATNPTAQGQGISVGMALADARAVFPGLEARDHNPEMPAQLLNELAEWCIRFTPVTAIDLPDGIILDVSGCTHLWGGDKPYLTEIITRCKQKGFAVRAAIADTIGAAWAFSRYATRSTIIETARQSAALLELPTAALRIEAATADRLHKLGITRVKDIAVLPKSVLHRRFGEGLCRRLGQALGYENETITPVIPLEPYYERLPCLEPILTATGIEIALQRLLQSLCCRLQQEEKGLRLASFKGYRLDGKIEEINIGTIRPTHNTLHIFKLFEIKIATIHPALGIELFVLEASKVEDLPPMQEQIWAGTGGLEDGRVSELIDRLAGRIGAANIHRYIPDEHHWPERSVKIAASLEEMPAIPWKTGLARPVQLLPVPEPIEVAAPIPDYPPMLFRYKGKVHTIKKADGPERIEREWWYEEGEHRDYYCVEDEEGCRYWVFRSGHYSEDKSYQWFIYGFFA